MKKIIEIIRENREAVLTDRIMSQLNFGKALSLENDGKYDEIIQRAEEIVERTCANGNPITIEAVKEAESVLEALRAEAKAYRVICAAHAHIDMNWQWGWDETVGIVIDTVSTMLKLMEEYPDFKFSLSQASSYKILADYAPDLFEQVKKRVHEGRWEVTAACWVEGDKNMPNGESHAMQLIEAKNYLSRALEIPSDSINVDFEPDTFGHSINVPEILSNAGIKYYYFCRGTAAPYSVFRWRAPSGKEILVNRENNFYSSPARSDMGLVAIEMAKKQGFKTTLRVYGVGDHGGGPSRRDIEMLQNMAAWPCFPDFILGTYDEFFKECEQHYDALPVVEAEEFNCIFDGCYNTQTDIKTGNKKCESAMYTTGAMNLLADNFGHPILPVSSQSKQKFLLNHFHDIITGSNTPTSKAFAFGEYQYVLAEAKTNTKLTARKICENIDTAPLFKSTPSADMSFGAGAGSDQAEVGMGIRRVYNIFNSLPYEQTQVVEIRMWDWHGDRGRLYFTDTNGNTLPHQVTSNGFDGYWGHIYLNVLLYVTVPAMGYITVIADEGACPSPKAWYWPEKRNQSADTFLLENEHLSIRFNPLDLTIQSVTDKESGNTYFDKKAGVFQYIMEAVQKGICDGWKGGMSAWLIGRYKSVEDLHKNCEVSMYNGAVRSGVCCEFAFHDSKLKFEAFLDRGSRLLRYKVDITWLENGDDQKGIPQLAFTLPVNGESFTFDVPFGIVDRKPAHHDLPANSFAQCGDITIFSKNTHGFRCTENALALTVIRAACDPDLHTELGAHTMEFAVGFGVDPLMESKAYLTPLTVMTNAPHAGTLPTAYSAFSIENAQMSTAYVASGHQVIRLYNPKNAPATARIRFEYDVKQAFRADFYENKTQEISVTNKRVADISLAPMEIATIIIEK